jgi:hemerythrin-like domain-containing protein
MARLYLDLGFEVAADAVRPDASPGGCAVCFGDPNEDYRSIYTRRAADATPAAPTTNREDEPVTETHPTQVLRDEHQWILAVADALSSLLAEPVDSLDYDRIDKCIDFIRLFADACHHGKEEDHLFTALVEQGMPSDRGPIAVMLHEHRMGREKVGTMVSAMPGARDGSSSDRGRLIRAGLGYVDLIRDHILKEDNVLFQMADQTLMGPACARLCAAYDGTCDHTFEGRTKAELEALGREILGRDLSE